MKSGDKHNSNMSYNTDIMVCMLQRAVHTDRWLARMESVLWQNGYVTAETSVMAAGMNGTAVSFFVLFTLIK